jgi:peptidoglycan-associated lipoprotein
MAVLLGALLLVGTGCTKSIQANSGSKSFEPGAKRDVASAQKITVPTRSKPSPSDAASSAAPNTPANMASNTASIAAPHGDSMRESPMSEPVTPIPSLSMLDPGPSPLNAKRSDEERIPGELLVAKTEPSDTSRRQVEEIQREHLATAAAGLEDVFFGYDSWQISNEGKQTLMLDAEWIKANPGQKVTIEGHCDERGTLAYNLVLGEKRARSVQKYLVELGIDPNRLTVVSYGKERPFCKDREEGCHQKNRRGHIAVRVQ